MGPPPTQEKAKGPWGRQWWIQAIWKGIDQAPQPHPCLGKMCVIYRVFKLDKWLNRFRKWTGNTCFFCIKLNFIREEKLLISWVMDPALSIKGSRLPGLRLGWEAIHYRACCLRKEQGSTGLLKLSGNLYLCLEKERKRRQPRRLRVRARGGRRNAKEGRFSEDGEKFKMQ